MPSSELPREWEGAGVANDGCHRRDGDEPDAHRLALGPIAPIAKVLRRPATTASCAGGWAALEIACLRSPRTTT